METCVIAMNCDHFQLKPQNYFYSIVLIFDYWITDWNYSKFWFLMLYGWLLSTSIFLLCEINQTVKLNQP